MSPDVKRDIEALSFCRLHPQVRLGTAIDRYADWLGRIYTEERFEGRIGQRTRVVTKHTSIKEVIPMESVAEYFEHFPVLEIDLTFYRPLLNKKGDPTQNFHVLRAYQGHLNNGDSLLLKVPQAITAPKLRRGGTFKENPAYLNLEVFTRQFYEPADKLLGPTLPGFIFEQEYLRK